MARQLGTSGFARQRVDPFAAKPPATTPGFLAVWAGSATHVIQSLAVVALVPALLLGAL